MSAFPGQVSTWLDNLVAARTEQLEKRLGLFLARHPELEPGDGHLIERDGIHEVVDLADVGLAGYEVERLLVFTILAADSPEPSIATTYWVAYLPKENLS